MRLQLFKYKLDPKLIAQNPPEKRRDARLMVVHRDTGEIEHKSFEQIIDYINEDDVLVVNDSYMMNSLIHGEKHPSNIPISVFLLREIDEKGNIWSIESCPARKVRVGNKIVFKDFDMIGEIISNTSNSDRMMKLITNKTSEEINKEILEKGLVKLPKYIKREPNINDIKYTRSIFAKNKGSVNHVMSSLHFDQRLLLQMKYKGINIETVTYHINNFPTNKFDTKTISNNKKIPEFFNVSKKTMDVISEKKAKGSKVFAVGYSSLMAIENSYSSVLNSFTENENFLIKTSFLQEKINVCDGYLTNFYESGSIFLIADSIFCGEELLTKAYLEAMKNNYKFLLFGDSLLII